MRKFSLTDILETTDVNAIILNLCKVGNESNNYNHNLQKLVHSQAYTTALEKIIRGFSTTTQLNRLKFLSFLATNHEQRPLRSRESEIRSLILQHSDHFATFPFPVLCEAYYTIRSLDSKQEFLSQQILDSIDVNLFEQEHLRITQSLKFAPLTENEVKILQKLDRLDPHSYTRLGKLNLFKQYATLQTYYRQPIYEWVNQLRVLESRTKAIPGPGINQVTFAYLYMANRYPERLLQIAIEELSNFVKGAKGILNREQIAMVLNSLKGFKYFSKDSSIDWDFYIAEMCYQCKNWQAKGISKIGHPLSYIFYLFHDKITASNAKYFADFEQVFSSQPQLIRNPHLWEFILYNRDVLPSGLEIWLKEFLQSFEPDAGDQIIYNYVASKLNLPQKRLGTSFYVSLRKMAESFVLDDEYIYNYLKENLDIKYIENNADVLLMSIVGPLTQSFWVEAYQDIPSAKQQNLAFYFEKLLNRVHFEYPRQFNKHQLQFCVWLFSHNKMKPFDVATHFYERLSNHNHLMQQFGSLLPTSIDQAACLWEQTNNNPILIPKLSQIFDKSTDLPSNPQLHRFVKQFKPYFKEEQALRVNSILNIL